ncbi:hypothetical protein [Paenibacillus terrigena]|uniref:hypothetical protein n=1 Tax=Paenibacillus terrigena TaxID=369333 RepID=UPI0028D43E7B|nr:hypothetical protein [Paenibacillus terrigena]
MSARDQKFPVYYDGSAHVEFAEEMIEGLDHKQDDRSITNEEWRRHIRGNPFFTHNHDS